MTLFQPLVLMPLQAYFVVSCLEVKPRMLINVRKNGKLSSFQNINEKASSGEKLAKGVLRCPMKTAFLPFFLIHFFYE
jgi:hypothetical protein